MNLTDHCSTLSIFSRGHVGKGQNMQSLDWLLFISLLICITAKETLGIVVLPLKALENRQSLGKGPKI